MIIAGYLLPSISKLQNSTVDLFLSYTLLPTWRFSTVVGLEVSASSKATTSGYRLDERIAKIPQLEPPSHRNKPASGQLSIGLSKMASLISLKLPRETEEDNEKIPELRPLTWVEDRDEKNERR